MSEESKTLLRYWLADVAIDAIALGLAVGIVAAVLWPVIGRRK